MRILRHSERSSRSAEHYEYSTFIGDSSPYQSL